MLKLHPAIAHFPVALILLSGIFAIISIFNTKIGKDCTRIFFVVGSLTTPFAVIAGLIDESRLEHSEAVHDILLTHKVNGTIISILSLSVLFWHWMRQEKMNTKEYKWWAVSVILISSLVFFQLYLGSKMVFEHGAGVKGSKNEIDSSQQHQHRK